MVTPFGTPGTCDECGAEVRDIRQHTKRVHNKKPDVELYCEDCGRKCKNQNQLTHHWKYVHKRDDDLKCNICRQTLVNLAKLRQHTKKCIISRDVMKNNLALLEDNSDVLSVHTCNLCDGPFQSMLELKLHTVSCIQIFDKYKDLL